MKRASRWLMAAFVCALLAVVLAVPWPFGGKTLQDQIAESLATTTGLPTRIDGRVTFTVLPSPQVIMRTIVIGDANSPVTLNASAARGKLRLLPLIAGRFEVSRLTIENPAIEIDVDAMRQASTGSLSAPATTAPRRAASGNLMPGIIAISGGRAILRGAGIAEESTKLDAINVLLDWRGGTAPAEFIGAAIWRGVEFEASALLGKPAELLRGLTTPFTIDVKARIGELRLDGDLSMSPRWQFAGRLRASTKTGENLAEWLGPTAQRLLPAHRIEMAANARILPSAVSLSGLALNIDDNQLTGALTIQSDEGKPNITGTLAAKDLVFDPSARTLPAFVFGPDGFWNRDALPLADLEKINLDLRLSTPGLRIGRLTLSEAALAAIAKDGRLEFTLSSARLRAGALRARLSLHTNQDEPQLKAQFQWEKMDIGGLLRDAASVQGLSGVGSGELEFRSHGHSIYEFVRNANGALRASLGEGSLNGVDFERAIVQAQRQPLSLPSELRIGRTSFTRTRINGQIDGGVLHLNNTTSESDTLRVSYGGAISLLAKTFNLDIDATRVPTAPPSPSSAAGAALGPHLRLDLTGPWGNPDLRLDIEGLINNSAAAAPLLRHLNRPGGGAPATPAHSVRE